MKEQKAAVDRGSREVKSYVESQVGRVYWGFVAQPAGKRGSSRYPGVGEWLIRDF